jgi:hypothetical protein
MSDDDEDLVVRLRRVGALVDPVPADVVLAGRSALAHRDLDLRLAQLVAEPAVTGAGTRGDQETWFTFEVDDVVIELALRLRGGVQQVVGQVDGATVEDLVVHHADGESRPDVDALGRFAAPVTPGPVRVVVRLDGGSRVATSWVVAPRP